MKTDLIQIFVASPSDTEEERASIEKIITEFNTNGTCDRINIRLESKTWEKNTFPSTGDYPQSVITKQIGDYDLFIGIMWKKFGFPTPNAGSATEEEFDIAFENLKSNGRCKNIMFFFNDSPLPQQGLDVDQYQNVAKFKNKIENSSPVVYYCHYGNDFEAVFRNKLSLYLNKDINLENKGLSGNINTNPTDQTIEISEQMNRYLSDISIEFTHPNIDRISFEDIYIPSNLKNTSNISAEYGKNNIDDITDVIDYTLNDDGVNVEIDIKYLILGDDASGKTALCKYVYKKFFNLNKIPILLSGDDFNTNIREDQIIKIINNKLQEQYSNTNININNDINNNSVFVVIIDDFHKSAKGNERYTKPLVSNLEKLFSNIIIVGDDKISTNDLTATPTFKNFNKYIIMQFGATLRAQLIHRWCNLGKDTCVEDSNKLYRKYDELDDYVKTILGKNYIPSYPFYILGILQAYENNNSNNNNYSIHGFYYELLINKMFEKNIFKKTDISFYSNFMTSFCYYLFELKTKQVTIKEFEDFFCSYCEKYDIEKKLFSITEVKNTFKKSGLIHFNNTVKIDKNYVYYFFIAKYIANNIDDERIKAVVSKLNKRLFREQYSSIIMFVTHLSKNKWIIQNLLSNANDIFKDESPLHLEADINRINSLILELPKQVIEQIDTKKERSDKKEEEEKLEQIQKEFDTDEVNYAHFSLEDDLSSIDIIAKMNLAMKTIDILGQIAKKYWGELDSDTKYKLVLTTYNLGLRSLGLYFRLLEENHTDIADYITTQIIEKHIKNSVKEWDASLNKKTIEQVTNNIIIGLCYFSSWGIVKRISNSIGYEQLNLTFKKVLSDNAYNSYKLIDFAIELNQKGIPMKLIEEYSKSMQNNKMCFKLLQDLAIDHMYMFEVSYSNKSQIQEHLKIDIQKQRYIQGSSQVMKLK